jgi:hypothetical protein
MRFPFRQRDVVFAQGADHHAAHFQRPETYAGYDDGYGRESGMVQDILYRKQVKPENRAKLVATSSRKDLEEDGQEINENDAQQKIRDS